MPSGGARVTSGPPPDPGSLRSQRRGNADGWRELPAAGRTGRAPKWPLEDQVPREALLWRGMWRKPQAVAWQALGLEWEVALHVRQMARVEDGTSSAALLMELRQHAEELGLLPSGLLRNRWCIAEAAKDPVQAPRATAAAPESAKSRLRAIAGGQRSG
jgi:hypothetical protein